MQDGPALYTQIGKVVAALKVDSAEIRGTSVKLSGWCAGDCKLELQMDDTPLVQSLKRTRRPDVAESLKAVEPEGGFGFELTARALRGKPSRFSIAVHVDAAGVSETFVHQLKLERIAASGDKAAVSVQALGYLEAAIASPLTHDTIVVGWAIHGPGVELWLENEYGDKYPVDDSFRLQRQDVQDAHGGTYGHASRNAGFVARLDGMMPGEKVKLMAKEDGVETVTLSATDCGSLDGLPASAARWLFGLGTPINQFHKRLALIDAPVIEGLIHYNEQGWKDLPVEVRTLGTSVSKPVVSVIVPLYGRSDFVENQLIEFKRDPWFCENAELIYVVDDPHLVNDFRTQAEALHRLYNLPFSWIWGQANRGFSGANNLGASHSKGDHLLFLNSDAFPQKPGWLADLIAVLDEHPEIGAVAPRLVFADGSIQHAAMKFVRREELGVWINHHPYMGMDPSLDPHKDLSIVPAVTGACLALRRTDFDHVEGWDSGYLIGDFEDSDLCLKLRSAGQLIAYLPTVQLTHLERQSFRLLGEGEFRTRVVIYNAFRHQSRWLKLIEASASETK